MMAICGIAGGVGAILGGFEALVIVIGEGDLLPAYLIGGLFFIMLMGVLSLVAIAQHARRPHLALILILV